jgi:hypothetical protein
MLLRNKTTYLKLENLAETAFRLSPVRYGAPRVATPAVVGAGAGVAVVVKVLKVENKNKKITSRSSIRSHPLEEEETA